MKKQRPNHQTDEDINAGSRWEETPDNQEQLVLHNNPSIVAVYPNSIVVYDCYSTDGSTIEKDGVVYANVAYQLTFATGKKPDIQTNVGLVTLKATEYRALHFYLKWIIKPFIKESSSMEEVRRKIFKLINLR